MRRFFGIWILKRRKTHVNLSENEIIALLQLMFELGIHYNKVSSYDFDSYIKNSIINFPIKVASTLLFLRRLL